MLPIVRCVGRVAARRGVCGCWTGLGGQGRALSAERRPAGEHPDTRSAKWSLFPEDDPETAEAKKEKKEILLERMRRSLLYDAQAADKEKLWVADDSQLAGADVIPFPSTSVELLDGSDVLDLPEHFTGKVSLVTLSFQALGKQQSDLWHEPFLKAFANRRGVRVLDIMFTEGWVFRAFKGMLRSGAAKAVAPAMLPHTATRFETSTPATEMLCHKLKVHNRTLGYAFLVDWDGDVRWMAHHKPAESELTSLLAVTEDLLSQIRSDRG